MSNPYANRPQKYQQPSSALIGRTNTRGYGSVAEGIAAMQAGREADTTQNELGWTDRAKNLGAGVITAATLGGVLWMGIHANHEANDAHDRSPQHSQDPSSLSHGAGHEQQPDDPNVVDYLQGDKGQPK